jgi:hypothetical protein
VCCSRLVTIVDIVKDYYIILLSNLDYIGSKPKGANFLFIQVY